MIQDKTKFLMEQFEDEEYEHFCKWCDEHNPDAWMTKDEWREIHYTVALENALKENPHLFDEA